MKVLVTGATGFAGAHSAAAMHRAGHRVRLLVRSAQRIARAIGPLGLSADDFEVHEGDVNDPGAVKRAIEGCDAVVHAAAIFTLDLRREAEVERTNVVGARSVLDTAVAHGLDPIVYVSSIAAFMPPSTPMLRADDPIGQPRDLYARTKAATERYARELQAQGHPVTLVYPGNLWGPDDPTVGDGVATVMRFVKLGLVPDTPGGLPVSDVRDLAALLNALLEPGHGPRRFMAGGHLVDMPQLATLLRELTGRSIWLAPTPGALMRGLGRAGDVFAPLGRFGITYESMCTLTRMVPSDDSAMAREFGLRFRPVVDTLRETLAWMLDQGLVTPAQAGRLADDR